MNSKFWNMTVSDGVGEVDLFGDISDVSWWGDEITPAQFKSDLDALGDVGELEIHINSGGGDVFAGFAIHKMLSRHKAHKTVYIDGLAASIASLIAMAGDEIVMPRNSMLMIHNAWAMTAGNATELRKMADELDKIDGVLRSTYVAKTGLDEAEITEMMANETWFTANDAIEKGFANTLEESVKIAASLDDKYFNRYQHVPDALTAWIMVDDTVNEPCDDLNNRGESEPVEEINTPVEQENADALTEQRKDFNRIREKIMKGTT